MSVNWFLKFMDGKSIGFCYDYKGIPFEICSDCHSHGFLAVQTGDVYKLGSSDAISAAGADVLSAAALLGRWGRHSASAVCASSAHGDAVEFVAGDKDVGQPVFQYEVKQVIAGAGDSPTILLMMLNDKTV